MKKITLVLVFLFSLNNAIGQPPPPGINYYYTIDTNNDGYTTFNIDYYINTYLFNKALAMGFNLSGYNLSLYPSYTDYTNNTDVIGASYINQVSSSQYCKLKIVYSGTGISYVQEILDNNFSDIILRTVNHDFDDDHDSVLNYLEDLNNDGILNNEDTDSDGIFNFLDDDDDGDGILSITEDYNQNGLLSDDDTNANGIPDYLDNTLILASESFITKNDVKLFPNPVQNNLTISTSFDTYQNIEILDLSGKVLTVINENTTNIDFSGFKSGIYFVKINWKDTSINFKIIKL
ncbi:T9SS type A sorting domain-containing protein [Flavobacterium difficile]|uniref:T9SS type A sorting domain-containing protein n=1 Tax=Flavobacterium difficile TaxID=2709659 RepID=A0ABX0I353_9FLAO|nr:T9SS type A sorting domain-containing protein [Flavobacterium difficile]NHM01620.1 T9SS type A sorting domain-containing protein [Flavobacterium difficile]